MLSILTRPNFCPKSRVCSPLNNNVLDRPILKAFAEEIKALENAGVAFVKGADERNKLYKKLTISNV